MKKVLVLFAILSSLASGLKAQLLPPNQPEQDACNALLLCGNTTSFNTLFSYVGIGQVTDITGTPCFGAEGNVVWLRIVVTAPGSIVFTISPVITADDYDFAVLDVTNTPCNALTSANVVRCNFNNNLGTSNINGQIGLSATATSPFTTAGATGGSYVQQILANAGDEYLIMINNFGQGTSGNLPGAGFTIDFAGSTATFLDNGDPTIAGLIPSCNQSQELTVQMSENIQCSSIAPDGSDFAITGGTIVSAVGTNCTGLNGYTDKIKLTFAASLPVGTQTLSIQVGTDGNSLLDLCDNEVALPETEPYVVIPYLPLGFVSVDTPSCRELRIKMTDKIRCDSIAPNGSDFAISGPQASSVIAAYGLGCDSLNFSDTLLLLLSSPLQTDGTYFISAKNGTDGNTVMDSCGQKMALGSGINFTINSYDGRIVTTPDTLLCRANYVNLGSSTGVEPPLLPVVCGDVTSTPCTGNTHSVLVSSGPDTTGDFNSPFFGVNHDSRTQYLYRGDELRSMGLRAGSIQTLEWLVTQQSSTYPYDNFTIKMGCTPLNDITGGTFASGLQTVYYGSYSPVAGWNAINLTTPFNWDGSGNVLVEICFDNANSYMTDQVAQTITPFSSVVHRYGNNLQGCAITTQGTLSPYGNIRPKLRFYVCEPPAGPPVYAWSPGTFLSDSTVSSPIAFVAGGQTYIVATIDKDGCAHRDSTHVKLSVRNPTLKPVEDISICLGATVQLVAGGGSNYTWIAPDLSTLSCTNCPDPIVTPTQSAVYQAVINDVNGCADTLSKLIHVKALPPVDILTPDTKIKYGQSVQIVASGAYLYSWSPLSTLSDPNIPDPYATPTEPTTYYVLGLSSEGCRNIDSIHIDIDYRDHLFVPSAFSPNADGKNDVFHVSNMTFQKLQEFRIFNRWGQEIFSTSDAAKGWDGTWKGVPQENGVYQFLIRVSYPDGYIETYKGDVTLVR